MNRFLSRLALWLPLLALSTGCSKSVATTPRPADVVVAPEAKSVVPAAPTVKTVDLTPWGIFAEIELPASAKVGRTEFGIEIALEGNLTLNVVRGDADTAASKRELEAARPGIAFRTSNPDLLVWDHKADADAVSGFDKVIVVDGPALHVQLMPAKVSAEKLASLVTVAGTLAPTEATRLAEQKQLSRVAGLKAAGIVGEVTPLGLALTVEGKDLTDDALEPLRSLYGVVEVTVRGAPRLTRLGLDHIAATPELLELKLIAPPFAEADYQALAGMKSLRALSISGGNLKDSTVPFLRDLTALKALEIVASGLGEGSLSGMGTLENLELLVLDNNPIKGSSLTYLKPLTKLTTISLNRTQLQDYALERLKGFKLTSLACFWTEVTDTGLASLAEMKTLVSLDLAYNRVTDAGLAKLAGLTGLKSLSLSGCDIGGKGVASLAGLKDLEELALSDTLIDDESLGTLAGMTKLRLLKLDNNNLTPAALPKLTAMKALETLSLNGTDLTAEQFETLKIDLPKLTLVRPLPPTDPGLPKVVLPVSLDKLPPANAAAFVKKFSGLAKYEGDNPENAILELKVTSDALTDADLADLRDLKKLLKLELVAPKLTDAGLGYLAGLTAIKELDLASTGILGNNFAVLKAMKELAILKLPANVAWTARQIAPLAELKNLENLNIAIKGEGTALTAVLASLPGLKSLEVANATNRQVGMLSRIGGLETLTLSGTISRRGIAFLKDLPRLNDLRLAASLLTDDGLSTLGDCKALAYLDIRSVGVPLGDAAANHVRNVRTLKRLTLRGFRLTDKGLGSIRDLSELVEVSLTDAAITDKGVVLLSELKELELLDLAGCPVGDGVYPHFVKSEELRTLDLSRTQTTGKGIEALKKLPRLRRILLSDSKANDAGLAEIGQLPEVVLLEVARTGITDKTILAMKDLRTLETLNLSGCKSLTDASVAHLKNLRSLKRVDLTDTPLTDAAIAELQKAMPTLAIIRKK